MEEKMTNGLGEEFSGMKMHPLLILRELIRKLWVVVLAAIIVGCWAYMLSSYTYTPMYQTSTTFVVSERDGSSLVYSNLSAAQSMATSFSQILNSDVMKKQVSEEIGGSINGTIEAEVVEETNILVMTVTAPSQRQAYLITQAILNNYEELAEKIMNNIVLDILQYPTVPDSPSNSSGAMHKAKLAAVLAAVASAAILCLLAYVRDTVKSVDEVEQKLDTRLLGTVYHENKYKTAKEYFKRRKKSILITDPTTSFAFSETFKKLRTRVEYSMRAKGYKVIMVTSVRENEGKSTVAANLALSLRKKNRHVLLIDADFRKPSIHKIMGYQNAEYAGITDYLEGKANLAQTLLTDKSRQMGMILGRQGSSKSVELTNGSELKDLLKYTKDGVDIVIIDTPPMSAGPEAECIAELCDCALLVVRQDEAYTREINDAIDALKKVPIKLLGCAFNNVHMADLNDSYNFGTGGKYGYKASGYGYGKYGYGQYDQTKSDKQPMEKLRTGEHYRADTEVGKK